jgi:hypothetical protein
LVPTGLWQRYKIAMQPFFCNCSVLNTFIINLSTWQIAFDVSSGSSLSLVSNDIYAFICAKWYVYVAILCAKGHFYVSDRF